MLTKKEANQIVADLWERKILDNNEVLDYLKSVGILDSRDMLVIMDAMLDNKQYSEFIVKENFFTHLAPNIKSLNTVLKMCRLKYFEHHVSSLDKLYSKSPDTVVYLYERLKEIDEYGVALAIGYMLGGMARIKPQNIWEIIDGNQNPTTNEKISYVRAIHSIGNDQKIPKRFIDMLISYTGDSEKNLKQHAVGTLVIRHSDVKRIQRFLITYAKQDDENKNLVLRTVILILEQNKEFCIKILKICSDAKNSRVIHEVRMALGHIAPKCPIQVLTILRKWCKKRVFHVDPWSKWVAREAGKGDIEMIETYLLEWISKEKNQTTMQVHLPHILDEIYKENEKDLLRLLQKVDFKHKKNAMLIIKTLEVSLSEGYEETERDQSFLDSCNEILKKIAEHKGLDVHVEPDAANEPVIYTLALVSFIRHAKKDMPSSEIKKNLKDFPNVVSFFGKNRLEKLIEEKPFHPLVKILSNVPVSEDRVKRVMKRIGKQDELWKKEMMWLGIKCRYYPESMFYDMEASLAMFTKHEQGRGRIRDGMLDENNFWPALIELNIAARFKKRYRTILQPPIGDNNKLDIKVEIDGSPCLFEIYSPKESLKMKYVRTAQYITTNKAKDKMLEKLEKQLKSAKNMGQPVVLIIDRSNNLNMDEIDIGNSLFGTYQWTMMINKENGDVVDEYATRKSDSISKISPYGEIISAVILLKRDMGDLDMKIKLHGKTFPNPGAVMPLSQSMIQKIENAILGQAVV